MYMLSAGCCRATGLGREVRGAFWWSTLLPRRHRRRHWTAPIVCASRRRVRRYIWHHETRPQFHFMFSNISILYQPWAIRREAEVMHRATFTSNTQEMLLRPILENGTIRTAIKTCSRHQSVQLLTSGFVAYLYIVS